MPELIATNVPGRNFATYDLLTEVTERYGWDRQTAHESIHAMLAGLVEADGRDAVIVGTALQRPELAEDNPTDADVDEWWTITDEAAGHIRAALAQAAEQESMRE